MRHLTFAVRLMAQTLCLLVTLLLLLPEAQAAEPQPVPRASLIAVIPADFPPTYFRDPATGQPAGLAVEVLNAVAERAGLTVAYRFATPWLEIEELVLQKKADLIPFRVMGDKNTKEFLFTAPLDITYINYIVPTGDASSGPKPGEKIGVIRGSTAHYHLMQRHDLLLVPQDSLEHLLMDLLSGQTDLVLTASANLQRVAEKLGLENRIRTLEPAVLETKRGIALRPGNELLLDRLNRAIKEFQQSPEAAQMYEKWLGRPQPYWTPRRTAIAMSLLLVLTTLALITWHNISLRRSNRRLKAEQAFLQTVIDAIPDFIFFKDRHSVYLGSNRAFAERVHGCSSKELVGLSDSDLHTQQELVDQFRKTDLNVIESDRTTKFEISVTLQDGSVIRAETIKTPFQDENGQIIGVIGIARDITERYRYQQQLEEARERAEASNRAKSQFLANMSHEIRTPLNGVLGMAQLLAMSKLDPEQQEQLAMIQLSGENLLAILNDILDLAKIEADSIPLASKTFSPAELLEEVATLCRFSCEQKGIGLAMDLDPDLPTLLVGDPLRIKQILFNLLGNAVKFTRQGRVNLCCNVSNRNTEQITLRFEVRDTGIGISPEDQERIFKPFEQVDNSNTREYGGTGLGLAICQRLAHLMGGSLTLTSAPDQGSCFTLTLAFKPLLAAEPAPTPVRNPPTRACRLPELTVLVAEDNEISRFFIVRLLQQMGHQALAAEDGQQALHLLDHHTCDLVLLDIQMPVLDGSKALQKIRQRDADNQCHTTVVALTAHVMAGDREKFLAQGFDDYLPKPLRSADLQVAIVRHHDRAAAL